MLGDFENLVHPPRTRGLYLQLTTCLVGGSSSTLSSSFCILNGVPVVPLGQKNSPVLFWLDLKMPLLARFGDIGILTPKRATTARIAASAPLRAAYSPFSKRMTQLHRQMGPISS